MKIQEFNKIFEERIKKMRSVMVSKGTVYTAGDQDRLHNFKVSGRIGGTSPETALKGMLIKHLTSVWDMIDECENCDENGGVDFDCKRVDEKIGDVITYMVLLEALFIERLQNQERGMSR